MFKDMLKERGKWSQGRVYLLVSVIVYYITLGFLMVAGLHKSNNDLDFLDILYREKLRYGTKDEILIKLK